MRSSNQPPLPQEIREVQAAQTLMRCEAHPRNVISLDAKEYVEKYSFIPIVHTVHAQSGDPIFIIIEKAVGIQALRNMYGLQRNSK